MLSAKKRKRLVELLGEDAVRKLENKTSLMSRAMLSLGIESKALSSFDDSYEPVIKEFLRIDAMAIEQGKQLKELERQVDEHAKKIGWVAKAMNPNDGRVTCSIS